MLILGWSDGCTFHHVNSILLFSENKKNRIIEASIVDKRTVGYKRRQLSMEKGTTAMLELLKAAKTATFPAKYVLLDTMKQLFKITGKNLMINSRRKCYEM